MRSNSHPDSGGCWCAALLGMPEPADSCKTVVPNLFGTRDRFPGRQCFHGLGVGMWFQDDSSALHLLCTLFLLLLHQLHLRSSGIRSWRLGTPAISMHVSSFSSLPPLFQPLFCYWLIHGSVGGGEEMASQVWSPTCRVWFQGTGPPGRFSRTCKISISPPLLQIWDHKTCQTASGTLDKCFESQKTKYFRSSSLSEYIFNSTLKNKKPVSILKLFLPCWFAHLQMYAA